MVGGHQLTGSTRKHLRGQSSLAARFLGPDPLQRVPPGACSGAVEKVQFALTEGLHSSVGRETLLFSSCY